MVKNSILKFPAIFWAEVRVERASKSLVTLKACSFMGFIDSQNSLKSVGLHSLFPLILL